MEGTGRETASRSHHLGGADDGMTEGTLDRIVEMCKEFPVRGIKYFAALCPHVPIGDALVVVGVTGPGEAVITSVGPDGSVTATITQTREG
jgi:hypothetical protein